MTTAAAAQPHQPKLERKAVGAVILGNALEFYDFTVYAFFAEPIGEAFFPSKNPTDSLLASLAPVRHRLCDAADRRHRHRRLADRAGRKPAMLITIALMAIGMLMLALAPRYETIGIWAQVIVIAGRLIQGLALGGEVGPSTAYLLEAAPPEKRAFVASWQIASQGCAAFFSGILAKGLTFAIGDAAMNEWGWRIMFLVGISVVPIGLVIRSHLPETAGEGKDPGASDSTSDVVLRLVRDHGRMLLLTFLVIAASTVSNSIGTNMPVYAKSTLGLAVGVSAAVPIALGLASIVFPLCGGWLADRIGRRPVMIWPRAIIVLAAVPAFLWLVHDRTAYAVYAVTFLMSALSSVNAAAIIVGIPEALPRAVRSDRPLHRLRVLGVDLRRQHELHRQQADRDDRRQARPGLLPRRIQHRRHDRGDAAAGDQGQGSRCERRGVMVLVLPAPARPGPAEMTSPWTAQNQHRTAGSG